MLIDGKQMNQQIGEDLLQKIKEKNIRPSLGILCVGNDSASLSFIKVKKNFGERFGFIVNTSLEPGFAGVEKDSWDFKNKIIEKLLELQKQNDAVIVQLPLPENLKNYTDEILSHIEKRKDVDNLKNGNFVAPIVLALKKIFDFLPPHLLEIYSNPPIKRGGKIGVVGLGQVVGLPIKKYLDENNFDVVVVGKGEYEKLQDCDVVISGVGVPHLIKKENLKQGVVLIDYGCSFVSGEDGAMKACGDFDPDCFSVSSYHTPVPGCMGPLVVASLFENVLKSALINNF